MQTKFCCVNLIGRIWRTWKTNRITTIYLISCVCSQIHIVPHSSKLYRLSLVTEWSMWCEWPDIATWRRSSGRGKSSIAEVERDGEAESNNANPYWSAREKLGKPLRQEAFSFAASTIVSLTKTHSYDFPIPFTKASCEWARTKICTSGPKWMGLRNLQNLEWKPEDSIKEEGGPREILFFSFLVFCVACSQTSSP